MKKTACLYVIAMNSAPYESEQDGAKNGISRNLPLLEGAGLG